MVKKAKEAKTAKTAKKAVKKVSRAKGKTVTVEAVVRFVKTLDELQCLDEFLELAQGSKAFVTLRGRSYDVVKRFVEQKRQGSGTLVARGTATPRSVPIDPCPQGFKCF